MSCMCLATFAMRYFYTSSQMGVYILMVNMLLIHAIREKENSFLQCHR